VKPPVEETSLLLKHSVLCWHDSGRSSCKCFWYYSYTAIAKNLLCYKLVVLQMHLMLYMVTWPLN